MKPNAAEWKKSPDYFRELVDSAGLTRSALSVVLGVDERTIRRWMSGERQFPYTAQFALECLIFQV